MGKRIKKVGTGITERSVVVFENPLTEEEIGELGKVLTAPAGFEDCIGKPTEAAIAAMWKSAGWTRDELAAEAVRRRWPGRVGADAVVSMALGVTADRPDSPEGYAARILSELTFLRRIRSKDPDAALMAAFRLGGLVTEAGLKFEWEGLALRALKIKLALEPIRNKRNAKRIQKALEDRKRWQGMANEIWGASPTLKKSGVARRIARKDLEKDLEKEGKTFTLADRQRLSNRIRKYIVKSR
jgi:hypothetical protein